MNAVVHPPSRERRLPLAALGVVVVLATVLAVLAVYSKERIGTLFAGGETITAEFAKEYKLMAFRTDVKVGGVVVGTVTGYAPTDCGTSEVEMQVDDEVVEKLGGAPTASIRPTLLLGGAYYVDLVPGGPGEFGGTIPLERTTLPVELDQVVASFTPEAREGMQAAIGQTEATLREGGSDAVGRVVAEGPETFEPTTSVLQGFAGTRPGQDLREVVSGFQATADVLTRKQGQVENIFSSLRGTTAALAAAGRPVADATATMPETLRVTRDGMIDLRGSIDLLAETADDFRPSARALEPLMDDLDPVLEDARPLLDELRPVLADAKPLVERLVPTAAQTTEVFEDVRGPFLDRLNGPITEMVLSPWSGTGPYAGGGRSGHKFYEETAYLVARASYIYQFRDPNGGIARLAPGTGANGPVGGSAFPKSLEQYQEMFGLSPRGPEADAGRGVIVDNPLSEQAGAPR